MLIIGIGRASAAAAQVIIPRLKTEIVHQVVDSLISRPFSTQELQHHRSAALLYLRVFGDKHSVEIPKEKFDEARAICEKSYFPIKLDLIGGYWHVIESGLGSWAPTMTP